MNIVIDTNIFISALIKKGLTRGILTHLKFNFLFPEFELEEIKNHKQEIIQKSDLNEKEFYILLLRLLKYVEVIPADISANFCKEAGEIMRKIDKDDVVFIATALVFNCPIWSDDKHFKKQNKIRILTTKDVLKFLE